MFCSPRILTPLRRYLTIPRIAMASNKPPSSAPLSYSAAVSGANAPPAKPAASAQPPKQPGAQPSQRQPRQQFPDTHVKRSPSPRHIPQTASEDEPLYVLTLLTDKPHHDRMTALREQYFPKRINKLEAHLTFFHALPQSKLEDSVIPVLQQVASETPPFQVRATKPFRLKKGIAISVAKNQGSVQAQEVHKRLQKPWLEEGWLSEQDRRGCRVHYTIMNKVDNETEVLEAFEEVQQNFHGDVGTAEGLGLWRYDRGFWRWERGFDFQGGQKGEKREGRGG